jgi:hypothetical protein
VNNLDGNAADISSTINLSVHASAVLFTSTPLSPVFVMLPHPHRRKGDVEVERRCGRWEEMWKMGGDVEDGREVV